MTFLPIVARELREAARRTGTYWARLQMALAAMLCGAVLLVVYLDAPERLLGRQMFYFIGGLSLIYCLIAGRVFTADCLSSEKREGTLGLLFLTDLKGHDVVLGKLAATSLRALYGLLAVIPIMAVPLLLGGITSGEFWRVAMTLANTFLFSLAIGIFASAISRDGRRAMAGNFAILLFFVLVLPVCAFVIGYFLQLKTPGPVIGFFFSSPIFTGAVALDVNYKAAKEYFWWSLGVIQVLAWLMLLLAGWILPRTWQDKPTPNVRSQKMGWREFWRRWSYGSIQKSGPFRKRLLDENAFYWLAGRARLKPAHVWTFLGLAGCWWLWGHISYGAYWIDEPINIALALMVNTTLKCWIALEAAHRIAEDQKSGALELVLTTPMTTSEIVRGQLLALRRQFLLPALVVIGIEVIFMGFASGHSTRGKGEVLATFVAGSFMLAADMLALSWVGMARALAAKSLNRAILQSIFMILVLPWMAFGLVSILANLWSTLWSETGWTPGWNFYLGWWFGLGLFTDILFGLLARRQLKRRFRQLAMRRYVHEPSRLATWWSNRKTIPAQAKVAPAVVTAPSKKREVRKLAVSLCLLLIFSAAVIFVYRQFIPTLPPPVTVTVDFSKGPLRIFPGITGAFWILPDGSLWHWGQSGGPGAPRSTIPERVETDNDWSQAVSAYDHCVGLKTDGSLWEWGWRGSSKFSATPELVFAGNDWTAIAASTRHAVAIKRDGTLWAWGQNTANQLGRSAVPEGTTPVQVGSDSNWVAAECLWSGSVAIRSDGTLWMWGQIPRFGNGQVSVGSEPYPRQVCKETNWVGFAGGGFPVLVRNRSGELWNPYYGVPDPEKTAPSIGRLMHTNDVLNHVAFAFASEPMLYELRNDGTLWGREDSFPIGPWKSAAPGKWRQIGIRSDWISICSGGGTAFGVTADGVIWMWGQDTSRELTMDFASRLKLLQRVVRGWFGSPPPGLGGVARTAPHQSEPRPVMRMIPANSNSQPRLDVNSIK